MKKGTSNQTNQAAAAGGDEALESLLRTASSRPEPSEATRREVRKALHAEWRAVTVRRRWRRGAVGFSLAAAAVLVLALGLWKAKPPGTTADLRELAQVERVTGQVRVVAQGSDDAGVALGFGAPVYIGQTLEVGANSGLALRLESGISLRIDENTRLGLLDEFAVELLAGRIYVDTGVSRAQAIESPGSRFQVFTPLGAISHIGTQYMVRLWESDLEVAVRLGSAQVRVNDRPLASPLYVNHGQRLALDTSGKRLLSQAAEASRDWEWAEALGPGFDLDGRTMAEFLDWVARETGSQVAYSTDEARALAEETVLRGQNELPPREALDVVLLTSDLSAELADGVISIRVKR